MLCVRVCVCASHAWHSQKIPKKTELQHCQGTHTHTSLSGTDFIPCRQARSAVECVQMKGLLDWRISLISINSNYILKHFLLPEKFHVLKLYRVLYCQSPFLLATATALRIFSFSALMRVLIFAIFMTDSAFARWAWTWARPWGRHVDYIVSSFTIAFRIINEQPHPNPSAALQQATVACSKLMATLPLFHLPLLHSHTRSFSFGFFLVTLFIGFRLDKGNRWQSFIYGIYAY